MITNDAADFIFRKGKIYMLDHKGLFEGRMRFVISNLYGYKVVKKTFKKDTYSGFITKKKKNYLKFIIMGTNNDKKYKYTYSTGRVKYLGRVKY